MRDVALVVLGALLGAGASWLLRPGGGAAGTQSPSPDSEEAAALRQRVADLEQRLMERPVPLASAPSASHSGAGDPAGMASDKSAAANGPTSTKSGGRPPDTANGDARRDPFLELALQQGDSFRRVEFQGWRQLQDPRTVPAEAPAPAPTSAELSRLLESGDRQDLGRALGAISSGRLREFLPRLTELVNQPERRDDVGSLIDTIARLKDRRWSALQATGAPDTPIDGDVGTAWASKEPEMGLVTLELGYDRAVRVDAVRIHETFAPGAVSKVEAKDAAGAWETIWEGEDRRDPSPTWFEPSVRPTTFSTNAIRVTVDTDRVPGWNEIDAVELVGDGLRQWAARASASSSFSD